MHRLCELSLSGVEIDWDVHPYRVVDKPERLMPAEVERAREHVRIGVRRVKELEEGLDLADHTHQIGSERSDLQRQRYRRSLLKYGNTEYGLERSDPSQDSKFGFSCYHTA